MPHRHYVSQDSEEETDGDASSGQPARLGVDFCLPEFQQFQPYVPESFADFDVYNASLECSSVAAPPGGGAGGASCEKAVSRSPTVSSCTSGYFSHSGSNMTLSDAAFTASDSLDQLSGPGRDLQDERASLHTKSASGGDWLSTGHTPPPHSQRPSAAPPSPSPTSTCGPPDVPGECSLSISQEFTDFQGAEEGTAMDGWQSAAGGSSGHHAAGTTVQRQLHNGKETRVRPASPACHVGPDPFADEPGRAAGWSSGDEGLPAAQLPDWMAPGEPVWVGKKSGIVHYVGGVEFAPGIWVGVELDLPAGKHNGTVQGRVYFRCPAGRGIFVKPSRLSRDSPSTCDGDSGRAPCSSRPQEKQRSATLPTRRAEDRTGGRRGVREAAQSRRTSWNS